MSKIRKHWKLSVISVLVIGGAVALAMALKAGATAGPAPGQVGRTLVAAAVTTPGEAEAYRHIRELRGKLKLTNENLAAVGCTQANAEAVLSALKGWYETNTAAYVACCNARKDAAAALREAFEQRRIDPPNETVLAQIPGLKAALTDALEDYLEMCEAAEAAAVAQLTEQQRARLATIKANPGMPRGWKYAPDLTAAQKKSLRLAHRACVSRLAAADDEDDRSAAVAALSQAESQILTSSQQTAVAEGDSRLRANMSAVLAAEQEILPVPNAL